MFTQGENKGSLEPSTVLIVDDDKEVRSLLRTQVQGLGYKVIEAPNGKVAQDILNLKMVDVVLSDIQMPYFTGMELLEWSMKFHPVPFILFTGFSHLMDTQKAHDLGVECFLAKPFSESDLKDALEKTFGVEEETPSEDISKDYCRVSIEDFVSDKEVEMDIYIKLSDRKFIRIAHSGGKLPQERISHYMERGVNQLYVRKEDFHKVLGFNVKLSKVVAKSNLISKEKKKRFMAHTAEVILENTFVNGMDEQSFKVAGDFVKQSLEVLTEDTETFDLLDIIGSHSDFLYAHSLGVSIYSVMIAKADGWTGSSNLFKLGLAGLMHDVGKKEIPREILEKSRPLLTQEERTLFESHCEKGQAILEAVKSMPSDVSAVALQHHENCLGQGYPKQLVKEQIHPMARIVAVADEFCTYALEGPHKPKVPAEKAIYLMEQFKKNLLDPIYFLHLKSLFKS